MNTDTINTFLAAVDAHPLLERLFFASAELAVLAVAVAVAITLLRIRSPRACAMLWLIVLAKPIVTLAFGAVIPVFRLAPPEQIARVATTPELPPVSSVAVTPQTWVGNISGPAESFAPMESRYADTVSYPNAPTPEPVRDWSALLPRALSALWLAGVALLALSTLLDRIRLHRFMARTVAPSSATEATLHECAQGLRLRQTPPLHVTTELESPAVVGWFRSTIVIPQWLNEPEHETALAWALRHELTHLKHRDPIANALRRLAQILFFFHPVTWWASRRWEAAVELACDRAVVRTDDDVTAYAEQLYAILVQARQQRQRTMATGLFATRTQINTRIAALLGNSLKTPARLGIAAAATLTLFAGTVFAVGGAIAEKEEATEKNDTAETISKTESDVSVKDTKGDLPARTLAFPEDRSMGTVWIGDPIDYAYTPDTQPEMNEAGGWKNLGEAKGAVEIPAGKAVWLDVGPKGEAVDLAPLATLPPNGVQYLDLYKLAIEDDALRHIAGLSGLEAVSLYRTKITDLGLAHLAALPKLRWLDLGATKIAGPGLGQLAACKELVHLDLNYIQLKGGPAAQQLGLLTSLQWLDLSGCETTGDDLKALAGLKDLVTLDLEHSPITNDDLAHLLPFKNLRHLSLEYSKIEAGYKDQLAELANLDTINVNYTAAPEAENRMTVLGGRVVNDEGNPVEGVKIEIYGDYAESVSLQGDEATSATDGRWSARLPGGWTRLMANLAHPDYISDRIFGIRPVPPESQLLDRSATFVMVKGTTFSGRVTDSAGKPVAGAYILHGYYQGELDKIGEDPEVAVADSDGRFTVANLEKRRHDELTVFTMEHGPEVVHLDYSAPQQPLAVTLGEGTTVMGVVKDAQGAPLAGAKVSIREWRPNRQHSAPRESISDDMGRFQLDHAPDHGELSLSVWKAGYCGGGLQKTLPFDAPIELALIKEGPYRGKAIDAITGQPISDLKVDVASRSGVEADSWHDPRYTSVDQNPETGAFSVSTSWGLNSEGKTSFLARVRAKGYRVTEAAPLDAAKLGEEVEIRMEPAPAVEGIVRGPDGKPVEGVQIAWAREGEKAFLVNGAIDPQFVYSPDWFESSDGDGHFAFAADEKPGVLVATHDLGIAWLDLNDHEGPIELALAPWVRVEGKMHLADGKITPVSFEIDAPVVAGKKDFFSFVHNSVNTDEAGNFVIEKIPAMPITVGVLRRWEPSHGVTFNPKPGDVVQADIGAPSHAVSGKLDLAAVAQLLVEGPDVLTDDRHLTMRAVPRGTADPTKGLRYIPEIGADGAFTIAAIPPGAYTLHTNVHATPPNNACGRGTPIGSAVLDFTVSDKSATIDLGVVPVVRTNYPQPDTQAPSIEANILGSEEPWSLADEKGKLVVLDFWATWCAPCVAAMPNLKAAYEQLPKDQVTMVGLNLDVDQKAPERFLQQKELPWKQVYIGSWAENNAVTLAYGVSYIPSLWIIDANGTVLARDVKPEELQKTVEALLQ
jgi:beta-lactamase regulating signal transducer with metallopeptidase domain/thiol-disulfide isomerase/thioredoxin/protocatechuate 3,4-dioxygenase beta subunit